MIKNITFELKTGTKATCAIHFEGLIIHVLDLNHEDTTSVTNAVNPHYGLLDQINDYVDKQYKFEKKHYFLYGTDAVISEYLSETDRFSFIQPTHPLVYQEFFEYARNNSGMH